MTEVRGPVLRDPRSPRRSVTGLVTRSPGCVSAVSSAGIITTVVFNAEPDVTGGRDDEREGTRDMQMDLCPVAHE